MHVNKFNTLISDAVDRIERIFCLHRLSRRLDWRMNLVTFVCFHTFSVHQPSTVNHVLAIRRSAFSPAIALSSAPDELLPIPSSSHMRRNREMLRWGGQRFPLWRFWNSTYHYSSDRSLKSKAISQGIERQPTLNPWATCVQHRCPLEGFDHIRSPWRHGLLYSECSLLPKTYSRTG